MRKCAKCRRKVREIPVRLLVTYDELAVEEKAPYGRCVQCLEKKFGGAGKRLTFIYLKRRK